MCLLITKPAGKTIKKEHLEKGFDSNPHGAGFAVATGGRIKIFKPYWKFAEFYSEYQKHEAKPMIIHFRWATHGSKNEANTHPFAITKTLAMGHNGVISKATCSGDESDTRAFIREKVQATADKCVFEALTDEKLKEYDDFIGSSKLAFMTASGKFFYVNKELGHDHDGCWYSNDTYKKARYTYNDRSDYNQSNNRYWYSGASDSKSLVLCIVTGHAHQERDCYRCWVYGRKVGGHFIQGRHLHVSRQAWRKAGLADPVNGYIASFPPVFTKYIDAEFQNAAFIEQLADDSSDMFGNKNLQTWIVNCSYCGRKAPRSTVQAYTPPRTVNGSCACTYSCCFCTGKLGRKTFDPTHTVELVESDHEWKQLSEVASFAYNYWRDFQDILDKEADEEVQNYEDALVEMSKKLWFVSGQNRVSVHDLHLIENVKPKLLGKNIYTMSDAGCVYCCKSHVSTDRMHLCIPCAGLFKHMESEPSLPAGPVKTDEEAVQPGSQERDAMRQRLLLNVDH